MKHLLFCLGLPVMMALFGQCGKDDDGGAAPTPGGNVFKLSASSWTVAASGGSKNLELEAPADWNVSVRYTESRDNWLAVDPVSGKAGKKTLKLVAAANSSAEHAREAVVTVKCGEEIKTVDVTQEVAASLSVKQTLYEVGYADTTVTVEVSANMAYTCQISPSATQWIEAVGPESKSALRDSSIRFRILANETNRSRSGAVSIVPEKGKRVDITVNQAGMPRFSIFQLNLWKECTQVPGAFDALVDQIVALQPDFGTFCELYKGGSEAIMPQLVTALARKGLTYYQTTVDGRALLSKYPIVESKRINAWMFKGVCNVDGRRIAIYPSHSQYIYYSCYYPRGYNDGGDNDDWSKMPGGPNTDVETILRRNELSGRPESARQMMADAKKEIADGALVFFAGDLNEPSHLDWGEDTKDLWDHNGCVVEWQTSKYLESEGWMDAYRVVYPDARKYPGLTWPCDNKDVAVSALAWAAEADERDRIDFIYYYPSEGLTLQSVCIVGPAGGIARSERVTEEHLDEVIEPAGGRWPSDHKGLLATFILSER